MLDAFLPVPVEGQFGTPEKPCEAIGAELRGDRVGKLDVEDRSHHTLAGASGRQEASVQDRQSGGQLGAKPGAQLGGRCPAGHFDFKDLGFGLYAQFQGGCEDKSLVRSEPLGEAYGQVGPTARALKEAHDVVVREKAQGAGLAEAQLDFLGNGLARGPQGASLESARAERICPEAGEPRPAPENLWRRRSPGRADATCSS